MIEKLCNVLKTLNDDLAKRCLYLCNDLKKYEEKTYPPVVGNHLCVQ